MTIGLVGKKCGMTRIFTDEGSSIPVTVIEILPNRVVQLKTKDNDGYDAVQVTTGVRKRSRVNNALSGHYAKANIEPGRGLWEFPIAEGAAKEIQVGAELTVDQFSIGQYVDVTGTTKGKGFAGTVKRHHFAGGDATHGNSLSHRTPGSIGQRQSPGKVFKGKKMSGHMGSVKRTIMTQKVIKLDKERNLVMIQGGVPGAPGCDVIVRNAVKAPMKAQQEETK